MKVFKFGGASVKNAQAIRNVAKIIQSYRGERLLVVFSAMGKTTNALEEILNHRFNDLQYDEILGDLKFYHQSIIDELFDSKTKEVTGKVQNIFSSIESKLNNSALPDYSAYYDSIVSGGEYLSTTIVSEYLTTIGLGNQLIDAASYILTDEIFQEGNVKWDETFERIGPLLTLLEDDVLITQGIRLQANKEESSIYTGQLYSDNNVLNKVSIYSNSDTSSITITDSEGVNRAVIGNVNIVTKKTGDTTKKSASSITLFDQKSNVIYSLPK